MAAGQLVVGMHVMRADGSVGVVVGALAIPGVQEMDNLEVAHDHTFAVGTGEWIVHNACE